LVEARQRDADESETSDLDALAVEEEKVDLVAMDLQTRRLSGGLLVGIGLIGLSAIWFEVLPALTSMLDTRLWEVDGVGGGVKRITIGAVLLASLIFVIAILASRNIPGLVDVMLLGRLGIESSTRYAISTLSQYAIVTAGVLVACSALGVTWSKVQWLVAALGVGLGFGLQEVVANFVCGIVLLFERPIRVGDVVTVGDSTGVVIRIRSRATTVRNWDRQEVVIPNKELITGRIVNWTLSDQLTRITVQVGIAYGSDTNHARKLLYQIVKENPNVLDDPHSLVTFEKFGDSTLNFNVRAFLANIDERLETIHELNTSINQRFADEGIEIAFPQRDLHVRSVDKSVKIGDSDPERTWGSSPDEIGS
jgi:potassium efflux system protein